MTKKKPVGKRVASNDGLGNLPEGLVYLKSGYYTTPFYYAKIQKISRQALTKRIQRGQMLSHRIGQHYLLYVPYLNGKRLLPNAI